MDSQFRRSIKQRRSYNWVVFESSFRVIIEEAFWLEKHMTNNEAKYKVLLYELELALKLGVQNVKVFLDSKLVSGT